MHDAPIEIVAYDEWWPAKFEVERSLLEVALSRWLVGTIEHIGSTAVANFPAKPVIDIMAPVRSLQLSRPAIEAAAALGYVYHPYKSDVMHWFCKPSPAHRTHHLHLVPHESELWHRQLAFRDALRRNQSLAAEYANLKKSLSERFRLDREAYTEAKVPFIERVLAEINDQPSTDPPSI
jgi:GrpB-like predicted nucleotidyltransferase (UPF0157 family)